jgi:hypothetical protein
MKRKRVFLMLLAAAMQSALLAAEPTAPPLVVHEWGTFTSLQDEAGHAIGGINTDDEPVPRFVHRLADFLLLRPTEAPPIIFQGAPRCHPDVTMRLETPVLYFHPPEGQPELHDVSVTASFRGGWLSEFYPEAVAVAPGLKTNSMVFGPLHSDTLSALSWNHLDLGGDWAGPATTQHVWTSPRAVRAAALRTTGGEAEKFLFYRGVAHIDAPISISQDSGASKLDLHDQIPPGILGHAPVKVGSLWLVDVAADGRLAFRVVPPITLAGTERIVAKVASGFAPRDYSEANRPKLEVSLLDALVGEGLFEDEARALLSTWELSYFKSAGLRLFFMVPRAWTDFYLPLKVSVPAEVTRVMVGRIELVTPEQRRRLGEIARMATNDITAGAKQLCTDLLGRTGAAPIDFAGVANGTKPLSSGGVSIPESYRLYLELGRFRNALILDEAARRPAPGLDGFISNYRLAAYQPAEITTASREIRAPSSTIQ